MAHAAFPLATGVTAPVLSKTAAHRLRWMARTLAWSGVLAVVTATALTHLHTDSERLDEAARSAEASHRILLDEVATTQRTTAIAADRADSLRHVVADQLVALDSRAGFLP